MPPVTLSILPLIRARKSISPPEGPHGTGVTAETLSTKRGPYASPVTAGVNVSVGVVLNAWTNV